MKILLYFTRAYPSQSAIVLVCLLVSGVLSGVGLSAALPLLSVAIDTQTGPATGFEAAVLGALGRLGVRPEMGPLLGVLMAAFALKAVILLVANTQVGYTVAHVATDLRLRLLRSLLEARWSYFTRLPTGTAANAMATEATRASRSYYHATLCISLIIEALVAAGVALAVSWTASVLAAAAGLFSTSALHGFVRMTSRAGHKQTRLLDRMLGRLTDTLGAAKLLKATGREELVVPLVGDTVKLNRALQKQVVGKEGLRTLQEPILVVFGGVGLWAAVDIFSLAASEAILLILLFAKILSSVNRAQRKYQAAIIDESALTSLLGKIEAAEREREQDGGSPPPRLEREVTLRDVWLEYDGRTILRGLSLDIPRGQVVAIVGASGAGKTTLVDLVSGLVTPDAGEVRIDGRPLSELDMRAWRRSIGYVTQEVLVFHDSVRRNVTLGDESVPDDAVERALREAGAWEFVSNLPGGLDAPVGERGSLVSGGQRQRLAIARALVHRPALLVLDEATAALDADAEAAVWATVAALRGRTTVVAISHQPSLVGVADRVYRIEDGSATRLLAGRPDPVAQTAP